MAWNSIILLGIILIPVFLLIIFQKKLKIMDQRCPMILTLFGILTLVYFIAGRWIWEWREFFDFGSISKLPYMRSVYYSKVLLLDLCPLLALLMPICLIFDYKHKYTKVLSPLTIIGAAVTLFGECIWTNEPNLFLYIFVGEGTNRLYFMMHFLSLILGVWVLIASYNFRWIDFVLNFVFLCLWLAYVYTMVRVFDIKNNATGMVIDDWIGLYAQYGTLYDVWPLAFPWIVVFWYSIAVVTNWIIMLSKNLCFKNVNPKAPSFFIKTNNNASNKK